MTTANRFLGYGRQVVEEDDIAAVVAVLRGDYLTQGPSVERFEAALAERVGARHAVAMSSATAALHVAGLAAGMGAGDWGLTSTLTFVASANASLYCGGEAMLADVDPGHLGLTAAGVRAALAARPAVKTVTPVHFGGLAAEPAEIHAAAAGRVVIEDASHSLGGSYADGRPVGCCAHSDMAVFSFHPVKPITTGEGGAVVTNDDELARRLRLLRNHGIERDPARFVDREAAFDGDQARPWYYEQQALGFNYRMTDLQAALGLSQLAKLERFRNRRHAIALHYDAAFAGLPAIRLPQSDPADRARSGHHLYVVEIDFAAIGLDRAAFMARLRTARVGSQVHYIPVHRQPWHRDRYRHDRAAFPVAEAYYRRCLSLPLHPGLTDDDVEHVVATVRAVVMSA